jgi:hypothetical protein
MRRPTRRASREPFDRDQAPSTPAFEQSHRRRDGELISLECLCPTTAGRRAARTKSERRRAVGVRDAMTCVSADPRDQHNASIDARSEEGRNRATGGAMIDVVLAHVSTPASGRCDVGARARRCPHAAAERQSSVACDGPTYVIDVALSMHYPVPSVEVRATFESTRSMPQATFHPTKKQTVLARQRLSDKSFRVRRSLDGAAIAS